MRHRKPRAPVEPGVSVEGVSVEMVKGLDSLLAIFTDLANPGHLTHCICLIALKVPSDGSMPHDFSPVEVGSNVPKEGLRILLTAALAKVDNSP